eukprot:jgi/Mesen1/6261/ME000323S05394
MAPHRTSVFSTNFIIRALLASLVFVSARAKTVTYDLKVTYGFWSPDCVERQIYLINGQYPGPTLTATEGDLVVVNVQNAMAHDMLSIHWHGITQYKTPFNDGASYISQCPIERGETYQYKFRATKAGTYFYHAHLELQRSAGLYGGFIVYESAAKPAPFQYDAEYSLIINDWWHKGVDEQAAGLDNIPFRFVGNPQSLLINGRGNYNCSLIPAGAVANSGDCLTCNASNPQCAPAVFTVQAGKTYRLRISSVASLHSLNLMFEGHNVTVVAADAYPVKPFELGVVDVYSGQSVDVLLTADQTPGNYWIAPHIFGRNPASTNLGGGILRYEGAPDELPSTPFPEGRLFTDIGAAIAQIKSFKALSRSPTVPKKSSRTIHLVGTQNRIEGRLRWAMNNISYHAPATPYYHSISTGAYRRSAGLFDSAPPPDSPLAPYDYSQPPANPNAEYGSGVYFLKLNSAVDIIMQNANTLTPNNSEFHPWHLHGHHFWVIGGGPGTYDPATAPATFNLVDPPLRHTHPVAPYGWFAIRFIVNNPGVWAFHCHVASHQYLGMEIIIADGTRFPTLPSHTKRCGLLI